MLNFNIYDLQRAKAFLTNKRVVWEIVCMATLFASLFKATLPLHRFGLRYVCNTQSLLRQSIDYSKVPTLKEEDLEEQFIKGHGPGGSNVNKRSNCVLIKHLPSGMCVALKLWPFVTQTKFCTGIVVKAHQSRLLDTNRKVARDILIEKLDQIQNGEESVASQKKKIEESKSSKSGAKRRKLQELKTAWKERERTETL